jgi:hypothetical protein
MPMSSWCFWTCRDNPFLARIKSTSATCSILVQSGLAEIKSGEGTLIAFATGPGRPRWMGRSLPIALSPAPSSRISRRPHREFAGRQNEQLPADMESARRLVGHPMVQAPGKSSLQNCKTPGRSNRKRCAAEMIHYLAAGQSSQRL